MIETVTLAQQTTRSIMESPVDSIPFGDTFIQHATQVSYAEHLIFGKSL